MEILKYESFLETMQFAALTNAQKLAKQEEERRKDKQEADNKDTNAIQQAPVQHDDTEEEVQMETGSEEVQMETEEPEEEPEG
jgi:exosome complex RNA-binding protein Csl4